MLDDVFQEILRVRVKHRNELEKYYAMMKLLPETSYFIGTPKQHVHPGMEKIMKNLGLSIPNWHICNKGEVGINISVIDV